MNSMKNVEIPQQEESVVEPVVRQPGPFSTLFDYDQEMERQEAMNKRRGEVNEKIVRGNALLDALNLLSQGVSGGFGASIPKTAPNQSVISAFNDYRNMDAEQRDRMERFRMLDLNNMARDLQYTHGLEAEERGREFRTGEREAGEEFQAGQKTEAQEFESGEAVKRDQARSDLQTQTIEGQKDLERQRAETGHYSYQRRTTGRTGMYRTLDPQMQTMVNDALVRLYRQRAESGDMLLPPDAIRAIEGNEPLKDESIDQLMMDNLDYLREAVPGFDQVLPMLQQSSQAQSQQKRNPSEGDSVLLEKKLKDAVSRFSKEGKPRKRIKDDKRPGASLEKQAKQNDRIGLMMRALKEFNPDITWEEAYNDAMEFLHGHYQKQQSFNAGGQGTIGQSMAYYPPQ